MVLLSIDSPPSKKLLSLPNYYSGVSTSVFFPKRFGDCSVVGVALDLGSCRRRLDGGLSSPKPSNGNSFA